MEQNIFQLAVEQMAVGQQLQLEIQMLVEELE
jgi:hypothetical protein